MTDDPAAVRVVSQESGRLVALELDCAPFPVRRVFVVTTATAPVQRGGHRPGCREWVVLTAGACRMEITTADGVTRTRDLRDPGEHLEIGPDDVVRYDLLVPGSAILVLADQPYRSRTADGGGEDGACQ